MNGTFYGIGVGPGDPELITVKAYRAISACGTLVFPSKTKENCYAYQIAAQICPEIEKKELLFFDFPMKKDKKELAQVHDTIYEKIGRRLADGVDVAFLTIGDPTVYSTFGYIKKRAAADQKEVRTLSGIPSFCAACARLGIALGEGKEQIHIIPGSYYAVSNCGMPDEKLFYSAESLTSEEGYLTLVIVKEKKR